MTLAGHRGARVGAWVLSGMVLATAVALAQAPEEAVRAPDLLPEGSTCTDCHARLVEGTSVHAPAASDCATCHVGEGNRHSFPLASAPNELCGTCHETDPGASVHAPVKEGRCTTCHDAHSAARPKLIKGPMADVCAACHPAREGERAAHAHGPYAGGLCTACHQPHAAGNDLLLVESGSSLCLGCHEQLTPEPVAGRDVTWHVPVRDDCTSCHSAHESNERYLLLKPPTQQCLECHTALAERLADSAVDHAALAAERGCASCHDPHASRFASLLTAPSADLCLACHDRSYPGEGGKALVDVAAELKAFPQQHGPIREKNCEGCHDPHASNHFRLLVQDYPARFYAPFAEGNYALCFECHSRELVRDERTKATEFRDGERNLHYLHVNRTKGRTCRACHAVHASDRPHHLRETTPFGRWELPVGYRREEGGGTCATGCHVEVSYRRGEG